MALIKCPECDKDISDTIKKCPNCGYKLKKKINKKITYILVVIFIILTITGIVYIIKQNSFSYNEKYAIQCTETLKNYMKSPDSFKLQDDCLIILTDKFDKYLFIDYTSANSYGANLRGLAIFKNYSYLGDSDSEKDDFKDKEKYADFVLAKLYLAGWRLYGDEYEGIISSEKVKAERIGRKLKIDYTK